MSLRGRSLPEAIPSQQEIASQSALAMTWLFHFMDSLLIFGLTADHPESLAQGGAFRG